MIEENISDTENKSSLSESNIKELINNAPPIKFERDENGLLKHIQYKFTPDGFVDWRGMVSPEHLYIKPDRKAKIEEKYGKKLEEIDIINDNVADIDLVILLAGIKRLAALRGFCSVKYRPITAKDDFAATICSIKWIPNFETEGKEIEFEGMANASTLNSNDMTRAYLVEMAENRSFARAVRNFLKISIVSKEELPSSNGFSEPSRKTEIDPYALLTTLMNQKGYTWAVLKEKMVSANIKNAANYNDINDMPKDVVFEVIDRFKPLKKKN